MWWPSRAKTRHEESGGDAFAGDVTKREGKASVAQHEEVVVVAVNGVSRATVAGEIHAGYFGMALGEEALLNLAGDLDLARDAFALGDFSGEAFEEFGVFEGRDQSASRWSGGVDGSFWCRALRIAWGRER
jgi:hypothetical protein